MTERNQTDAVNIMMNFAEAVGINLKEPLKDKNRNSASFKNWAVLLLQNLESEISPFDTPEAVVTQLKYLAEEYGNYEGGVEFLNRQVSGLRYFLGDAGWELEV